MLPCSFMAMRHGNMHDIRCNVEAAVRYAKSTVAGQCTLGTHNASQKSELPKPTQMAVCYRHIESIRYEPVTISLVWMNLHVCQGLSTGDIDFVSVSDAGAETEEARC